MTQRTQPAAAEPFVVLIFGIVKGRLRPQAARFRPDEIELARYLAAQLELTMLPIDPQLLQEIGLVIPEWQLRPDDQVVVSYVRGPVFEQLRQLAQSPSETGAGETTGIAAEPSIPVVPKPAVDAKQAGRLWDGIGVGNLVLASEPDEDGGAGGWWEAVILAVQDGMYLLRWREPLGGIIRRQRHQLALLHPDSDKAIPGEC